MPRISLSPQARCTSSSSRSTARLLRSGRRQMPFFARWNCRTRASGSRRPTSTSLGPGAGGGQVTVTPTDAPPKVARLNFDVRERFSAPGYGDPAPRSASPTLPDVGGDASRLCTNQPPCGLHDLSIADALQPARKALVVAFATPAFCTSALCGPELGTVLKLRDAYLDRVNFVHVEIYQYPFEQQKTAKTVDEWHLPSEPWVFMVDRDGVVRDRFEGSAPLDELEPALKTLV